jgi:hypothetical protein
MRLRLMFLLVAGCALCAFARAQAAPQPFTLHVGVEGTFLNGNQPTEGNHTVRTDSNIYLSITKTNTSKRVLYCSRTTNRMTGLDAAYEYDVRDRAGNPVAENAIKHRELGGGDVQGVGCELKPGASSTSGGNEITRLYNLSQPGEYEIQVSQPVSNNAKGEVVRSNTITITVTDDGSAIERVTPPFRLRIAGYSDGKPGEEKGLEAKVGSDIGINIEKINASRSDQDCSSAWSNVTGLDEMYEYDVRDKSGNPVAKHSIERPMPYTRGPGTRICKPGEAGGSGSISISRLYDLSRPGEYSIQISQPAPGYNEGVVKSNVIIVAVTE